MSVKKKLYDILGLDEDASEKDIKDAYQEKAKANHPDKGGEKETFQEIVRSYSILSNPKKRKKYDETGNENPEQNFETRFMSLINQIFMQIIEKNDIQYTDLINEFKIHLIQQKASFEKHKIEQKK